MRTLSSSLIVLSPAAVFDRIDSHVVVEEDSMRSHTTPSRFARRGALVALSVVTLIA